MKCQRCDKESTGILIHLCDEHFDEWEREARAAPTTVDVGPIDARFKYQSAGGTVPDNVKALILIR